MRVIVEADGGSRGNPGPAGYGAVVFDAADRSVLAERSEFLGRVTNNVAEYRGLIAGLRAAAELGATEVDVRMDSKLIVEQMSGRWQVKHPDMRPLAREAADLLRGFGAVTLTWIPRERNKHADRLANEAMDRGEGKVSKKAVTKTAAALDPAAPARHSAAPSPAPGGSWLPPSTTPTRLLLVRHGATAHSAEGRFSGRNDLALTDAGQQQAAAVAARLATLPGLAAVVSSPLRRTRETADAIAAAAGLPLETLDDLAETDFGVWEGLTFAEVRQNYPDEMAEWLASPDAAPPGGESFVEVARRARRGRDAIIARHPDRTVVVVSHVTPIKSLLRLALDAPPASLFRFHLDNASLSTIDYFADGNSSVRLMNDTSHLA